MTDTAKEAFPDLPLEAWIETKETLHRFVQMVGKIRLAASFPANHWWNVPLYVTARGVTTSPMYHQGTVFEISLDYVTHQLTIDRVRGRQTGFSLDGLSVAGFYERLEDSLEAVGIGARMAHPTAFDLPDGVTFADDHLHQVYDPSAVTTHWAILTQIDAILKHHAGHFTGKQSPVHHFWHTFDITVSRFSGRPAPVQPTADPVTVEAYAQEVAAFGFWFGDDTYPAPALYAYVHPEPSGLTNQPLAPHAANWAPLRGGHLAVLPYADLRSADDPHATGLGFYESAWKAMTTAAGWDHDATVSGHAYAEEARRAESGTGG